MTFRREDFNPLVSSTEYVSDMESFRACDIWTLLSGLEMHYRLYGKFYSGFLGGKPVRVLPPEVTR